MVRAGIYGEDETTALEKGLAIIGFKDVNDVSKIKTRDDIIAILKEAFPDDNESRIMNLARQFYSFVHKIEINDLNGHGHFCPPSMAGVVTLFIIMQIKYCYE
jgi:restriction system protein